VLDTVSKDMSQWYRWQVFTVPRGNGKSMALTCPSQCTYRLTGVTVRIHLAQQSTHKTFQGPWGPFNSMKICPPRR
jgi:hypothetical protein